MENMIASGLIFQLNALDLMIRSRAQQLLGWTSSKQESPRLQFRNDKALSSLYSTVQLFGPGTRGSQSRWVGHLQALRYPKA